MSFWVPAEKLVVMHDIARSLNLKPKGDQPRVRGLQRYYITIEFDHMTQYQEFNEAYERATRPIVEVPKRNWLQRLLKKFG